MSVYAAPNRAMQRMRASALLLLTVRPFLPSRTSACNEQQPMTTTNPKQMHCARITRHFDASPERVFDAWLNPQTTCKWLFASPTDEAYAAVLDARVGGQWTITARRDGTDYTAVGEYLAIERPSRLVFTFAMPQFAPDVDRITIAIAPEETGCTMSYVEEGLPPADREATEAGWNKLFDALADALR